MNVGYYVTAREGSRTAFLAGPLPIHALALDLVEPARKVACSIDPWLDFAAFGTTRIESEKPLPNGKLNEFLSL